MEDINALNESKLTAQESILNEAKLDENGKIQLIIYYEGHKDGAMAYFIDNNDKKVRIANELAYKLIDDGKAVKINKQDSEWLPKDYSPNLSVEDWLILLKDEDVFNPSDLEIMKRFQDYGGAATCTQLSNKYGETWQFYNNKSWNLGDKISKKTGCSIYQNENGANEPWTILFLTRKANKNEAGRTVFKLRDELAEALAQIDLSHIKLYSKDKESINKILNDLLQKGQQNNGTLNYSDLIEAFQDEDLTHADMDRLYDTFSKYGIEIIDTNDVEDNLSNNITSYDKGDFLNEVYMSEAKYDTLVAVLQNKKNIILQGAPGVGKTFAAKRLAYSMIGEKDDSRIEFVQFHQNYSYEDFVMGYKPTENGFKLKYGIFYNFCKKAAADLSRDYFFIIDEINRGNMSKIFGELLMLIERDYRNTNITLAYNGEDFSVPNNLYIIGMMNTADRSLAMIDYALRRRFSFFDMEPAFNSDGFKQYQNNLNNNTLNKLINKVKGLNKSIAMDKSLGKGFCIGHSYFCGRKDCNETWLKSIVEYDILPMLSEYWFDDSDKLQSWENTLRGVFDEKV